jgi:hypothetical protein
MRNEGSATPGETRRRMRRSASHAASRLPKAPEDLRAALANPRWRFLALLALWELAPVAAMLRHSQTIYPHYLLVALPAAFLILGIFLAWAAGYLAQRAAIRLPAARRFARGTGRASSTAALARIGGWSRLAGGSGLLAAFVLLLALAQTYGTGAGLLALQRGAFDATPAGARYGLPLDAQRAALLAAQRAARPLGASVFVATDSLHQRPLGYLATTGDRPATVYEARDCLVAPAGGATPQVTLAVEPGATSGELLRRLQGVTPLETLPIVGNITPALYRIPPGATLPGEIAVPLATATPGSSGPTPTGYLFDRADDGSARLVVHWGGAPTLALGSSIAPRYVYGASPAPGAAPVAHYRFVAQPLDVSGNALGAPLVAECPRFAWGSSESVYAWIPVPASPAGHVASWRLWAEGAPYLVTQPTLGPLRFASGDIHEGTRARLGNEAVIPAE